MSASEIEMVRTMLAALPGGGDVATMRAGYDAIGNIFPTAADVVVTPVDAGGVPGEWTRVPGAAQDAALLYLHGGGYVIGSIASHRHLASELGRAAGIQALALEYRLAPEAPFPAAVDDALAGYRWLLGQGIAPGRISVAGDSAGGGLTMALLLAIKAAGLPLPACAVPISPWVDLEGLGGSMDSKAASDPIVQREGLAAMAGHYLNGANPHDPLAAPLYGDLTGLPPLLIQVGSEETLLDDAVRLAAAAGHARVPVRLEIAPDMIHVFHFFHPVLAAARAANAAAGAFIAGHLAQ
ncbi:MAG: alpha/beta hydrolase [Alphaproteobacteria bacterium PA4]|nr:MAG: alpha/beta hydrolase [Alphaproteobacteria bacterium PA4]